jgi:hypothetical protein
MSSAKRVERRCREKGKMKDFLEVKKGRSKSMRPMPSQEPKK